MQIQTSKFKKILSACIACVLFCTVLFFVIYKKNNNVTKIVYTCADEKKVDIVLKKNSIDATLEAKEHVRFRKDISNDAASRYVSKNPKMVLWMNNKYIMIEKENTVPYYDCSVGGPVADELSSPTIQIPSDQVELAPKVK